MLAPATALVGDVDCGTVPNRPVQEKLLATRSDLSICVIIPAYNAEHTLPGVIQRVPETTWDKISRMFIIDDGSSDRTAIYAADLAERNSKVILFSFPHNRGYGAAVRKGIQFSQEEKTDLCVCLHADGQYPPEKIESFIHFMVTNGVDILQGSRHKGGTALRGNMPLYKYIFGKILVFLENRIFGLRMTDYHSGYLFYSRKALSKIPFEQLSSSFDFDLEVIASARARNLKIEELAIPTHYGDEKSYLNPTIYGLRVLRVLFRYAGGVYDSEKE
jgi:glycosyltransferase involved in cell wall biosynthesis